jgi:PAS domain-containing protein
MFGHMNGPGGLARTLDDTVAAAKVPAAGQRDILRAVAGWAARLLPRAGPRPVRDETPPDGAEPAGGSGLEQAFGAADVGAWVWYVPSGLLDLDALAMALLGIDPDAYDGHIESWLRLVHPDDIPWVTVEIDKAISTLGPYDAEYRVCRPDGTTRWLQIRGRVEPDADGNPGRMLGTAWDTTESRVVRDGVRSALRYMSDGFLSLDRSWRITFANVEAERLLGSPRQLAGRVLWDLLVIRRVSGLESRCRRAAAGTTPASFDAEWPDTGRWYRFRFVPVPDGLAWYFADITDSRRRLAEQAAAERAAAERAARIQELTAALAEAVTWSAARSAVSPRPPKHCAITGPGSSPRRRSTRNATRNFCGSSRLCRAASRPGRSCPWSSRGGWSACAWSPSTGHAVSAARNVPC